MALKTVRLLQIAGLPGRLNDIVYCRPPDTAGIESVVVFFGGDVQDFTENMESHRDNKNYTKWSLDRTAVNLSEQFTNSHIVVVKPARLEIKTFSCFDNFVPSNDCGAPTHVPYHSALIHLKRLLENIWKITEVQKSDLNVTLVGFSKGCVVLNQFLHEFHHYSTSQPQDDELKSIVTRIKDMFWLDGGHSGGKNTWITSSPLLECLNSLDVNIFVHVTPYQIEDDRRPWIRNEERLFTRTLTRLGAKLTRRVHFEGAAPNLFVHFELLNVFHRQ